MTALPHLTSGLPGIGGVVKRRAEDLRVEEIPLPRRAGRGRHLYFQVTKSGITTQAAAERIARHVGARTDEIGYAGLKDAQAVATQWMSLKDGDPRLLASFRDRQIRIRDIQRRPGKLVPGELAGNRFIIRIRDVGKEKLPQARAILDVLARRGVPNYFGRQRFGARGDNAAMGEALVRGNLEEFVAIFLGRGTPADPPDSRAARDAFDLGMFGHAMRYWPRHCAAPRKALAAFMKNRRAADAVAAVDKWTKRIYVEAFAAELFNKMLARRIETMDRVLAGDLAEEQQTGRLFRVDDPAGEQARAKSFAISPTGPLAGRNCPLADERPGEIERQVLKERNVDLAMFERCKAANVQGGRRALRFRPAYATLSAGHDRHGSFIDVCFTAPPGCYATVLIDEICK